MKYVDGVLKFDRMVHSAQRPACGPKVPRMFKTCPYSFTTFFTKRVAPQPRSGPGAV
jgi:hypothetical protein